MANFNKTILFVFVIIACVSGKYEKMPDGIILNNIQIMTDNVLINVPIYEVARSPEPRQNGFCQGCRSIVSFMGNLNQSESREQFKPVFRDFCETYYPPSVDNQGPCTWFVNGIFFVIDRTDPVYHCDQIGACGKPASVNIETFDNRIRPNYKENFCSVCEELVNDAKAVLDSPMAIDMAHKQLDMFCDYLAIVGLSGECKQQVGKYIDQVVNFIREVDPLNYCQSIQLCDKRNQLMITNPLEFGLSKISSRDLTKVAASNQFDFAAATSVVKPLRGANCVLCKTVVKELFHFLKENKTEENIRYGLESICKLIYSDKSKISECDDMVDSYTRELIEFLAAESDPNLICILIDQCTYQKEVQRPSQAMISLKDSPIELTNNQQSLPDAASTDKSSTKIANLADFMMSLDPSLGSFETCLECKVFIRYLRDQIDKPHTEEKIKELILTKLCNNLGDKELQSSCKNLVDNYADIFFKAVIMELNPESACIAMAACRNKTEVPLEAVVITEKEIPIIQLRPITEDIALDGCGFCQKLVDEIDEFISTYAGDVDLKMLERKMCEKFEDKQRCSDMIQLSGPEFLQHVGDMKGSLGACQATEHC